MTLFMQNYCNNQLCYWLLLVYGISDPMVLRKGPITSKMAKMEKRMCIGPPLPPFVKDYSSCLVAFTACPFPPYLIWARRNKFISYMRMHVTPLRLRQSNQSWLRLCCISMRHRRMNNYIPQEAATVISNIQLQMLTCSVSGDVSALASRKIW